MLRRLVLTATVSAAALAVAVPGAGAVASPLPLPVPLVEARDPLPEAPEALPSTPDRLSVTVSETGNTRTDGRYELECTPAGGTHPSAQSACERLDELARQNENPFAPVPEGQMCTQQFGGPVTARVTGTWQGKRVDATFNKANGCEISRWQTMEPVLPNTRS